MILVIEGIDGAGKTSLAVELATRWASQGKQTMYVHNGASEHPLRDYVAQAIEALEFVRDTKDHVIIDRFNLGEQVYPFTRRDGIPRVTPFEDDILVQLWAQLGFKWAVLVPPTYVALERLEEKGETDVDRERLERERHLFVARTRHHQDRWPNDLWLIDDSGSTTAIANRIEDQWFSRSER